MKYGQNRAQNWCIHEIKVMGTIFGECLNYKSDLEILIWPIKCFRAFLDVFSTKMVIKIHSSVLLLWRQNQKVIHSFIEWLTDSETRSPIELPWTAKTSQGTFFFLSENMTFPKQYNSLWSRIFTRSEEVNYYLSIYQRWFYPLKRPLNLYFPLKRNTRAMIFC